MITKTYDTSLLKDALAKALGVLIMTYTNLDENPDGLDRLPWERNVELEQMGLERSPEYAIFVVTGDGNATIFRGFTSHEHAQDVLRTETAKLGITVAQLMCLIKATARATLASRGQ